MWCRCCARPADRLLCRACSLDLADAPVRRLAGGLVARAAFEHQGTARLLIHRLKYRADQGAAAPLVAGMARALPPSAAALVPVPRARLRTWRYGLDPAVELANRLGSLTCLPVVRCLGPGLWWPRHAGDGRRPTPALSARRRVPAGAVLVDDVLTTGTTLAAAHGILDEQPIGALTATAAVGRRVV